MYIWFGKMFLENVTFDLILVNKIIWQVWHFTCRTNLMHKLDKVSCHTRLWVQVTDIVHSHFPDVLPHVLAAQRLYHYDSLHGLTAGQVWQYVWVPQWQQCTHGLQQRRAHRVVTPRVKLVNLAHCQRSSCHTQKHFSLLTTPDEFLICSLCLLKSANSTSLRRLFIMTQNQHTWSWLFQVK